MTIHAAEQDRSKRGTRLVEKVPQGHWKTTTVVAFCEHMLAPTLSLGDIVVRDNLSSHEVQGVCEAIKSAGARMLCLPPYSPDLNPVENAHSKIKQLQRTANHG